MKLIGSFVSSKISSANPTTQKEKKMFKKYIKPLSTAWWSGAIPLVSGLVKGTESLHDLQNIVQTIDALSGGMPAVNMILFGAGVIGLRGKDG